MEMIMELTEQQLQDAITKGITAAITENNKQLVKISDLPPWFDSKVTLDNFVTKDKLPDTTKFVTKEFLESKLTAMDSVVTDAIKKVNEDIQKLVKKVFPDST